MSTPDQEAAWEMAVLQEQLLKLPTRAGTAPDGETFQYLLREDVLLLVDQAARRISGQKSE